MFKNKIELSDRIVNHQQLTLATIINKSYDSVDSNRYFIGVSLALLSSLFIGSSFILKKKGLINLTNYSGVPRAGLFIA